MAQSQTELFNLALSAAGTRSFVSAPNEASREAEICRLWYEPVRRQILQAAPWPSTRSVARLALLSERVEDAWAAGKPLPQYQYAYALPANCLRPRFLSSYSRFEISLLSTTQQAIMTSAPEAIMIFTFDQFDPTMWDPSLYLAIAAGLASKITMPLTGKQALARIAFQEANFAIGAAQEAAANEDYAPVEWLSEGLQARGSSYGLGIERFIYPNGPMLTGL